MNRPGTQSRRKAGGFTLVEMMVTVAIAGAVVASVLSLFIVFLRSYNTTTLLRTSAARSCLTLERMVFGIGTNAGLREAQSLTFSYAALSNGWQVSYNSNLWFRFNSGTKKITDQTDKVVGMNIITSSVINYTNSCLVSVTVAETGGNRTITNSMQTLVEFRN